MKFCRCMQLVAALAMAPLYGQEEVEAPLQESEAVSVIAPDEEDDTPIPGLAAADSSKAAQSTTTWKNWAVAGGAVLAAIAGVIVVAANSGSASDHE